MLFGAGLAQNIDTYYLRIHFSNSFTQGYQNENFKNRSSGC